MVDVRLISPVITSVINMLMVWFIRLSGWNIMAVCYQSMYRLISSISPVMVVIRMPSTVFLVSWSMLVIFMVVLGLNVASRATYGQCARYF